MKKGIKLSVKMGILVGLSIVISALAVEIMCLQEFKSEFGANVKMNLETVQRGILNNLNNRNIILRNAVVALSGRPNFIEAMEEGDASIIGDLAEQKRKIVGNDIMFVTDERGRVIAGSGALSIRVQIFLTWPV